MATSNSNPNNGKLRLHDEVGLPIDGLPQLVQQYIREIVRVYHCPIEFPTVAAFSAIATAIGKRVVIYDGNYRNRVMLWFVNVAISGSNKTKPVKEVLRPLFAINKENYGKFDAEYSLWKADKERDEANPPTFDQLMVGDCTEEARNKILQCSSHGVLGYYPEIKGYFDDMDRYNKGGFVDKLLRLFDGDDILINRKNDPKPLVITDAFMNILGDIQPGLLKATFGNPQFMENGLNQRFLFTMPKILEIPAREVVSINHDLVSEWGDVIRQIYNLDLRDWGLITFSPESDKLYEGYYNAIRDKKNEILWTNGDEYLFSLYSKLQIQAQRLAGIVHLMGVIYSPHGYNYRQVSAEDMEYTIRCMHYFEKSAIAVYNILRGDVPQVRDSNRTQAQIIRDFNKDVPIKNKTAFAESLGKDPAYISRILKG